MNETTTNAWLRQGCSLIWDPDFLTPLLQKNSPVPLREVLLWSRQGFPAAPPVEGSTVLVAGLQTCLETLPPAQAFTLLRTLIQPMIRRWQDTWPSYGLVFGLKCSWSQWRIDTNEHAHLRVRTNDEIDVTFALWNGAARGVLKLVVSPEESSGLDTKSKTQPSRIGGFYARRLS